MGDVRIPDDTFISRDAVQAAAHPVDLRMRRASRADFKAIWTATVQTVWDDTPADEKARLDRASWERHFRKRIEPYVDGPRTEAWVAEDARGGLVGYVLVGAGGGFLTPEYHGFLFDLWVSPEHRRKDVGSFLLSWATEWARGKGYRKMKLEVAEANAVARRLYEKMGFRAERHYLGKSLD